MPIRSAGEGGAAVVTHRCDQCSGPIEVLDLVGLRISWRGKRSTVEWDEDARYLCHGCRIALAPLGERDDLAAHYARLITVRDRLGVPPEVTLHLFHGRGRQDSPKLRDFRLVLCGIQVRRWEVASPIPSLRVDPDDGRAPIEFAFPQIVVAKDGIRAALECRWSTDDPRSAATALEIVGWRGEAVKLTDLHALVDGLALLRDFPVARSGRTKDTSRTIPPAAFAERLPDVYGDLLRRYGQHPSNGELAAAFCVSEPTLKRYKAGYLAAGGRWPPATDY